MRAGVGQFDPQQKRCVLAVSKTLGSETRDVARLEPYEAFYIHQRDRIAAIFEA
jgi:hypothetical protein